MKKFIFIIIIITQTFVVGCAISPTLIAPIDGRSAIAIKIWIDAWTFRPSSPFGKGSAGIQRIRLDYIFFIKLNNAHDTFEKKDLFVSNFYYQSVETGFQMDTTDSFCMNVEPGIYAAVGAVGIGQTSGEQFLIYFPKDMIEASTSVVRANTITYMGEFVLNRITNISIAPFYQKQLTMGTDENPDNNDPQRFYFENHSFDMLMLNDKESVISEYRNLLPIMASLSESNKTVEAEIEFLNKHIKTFENSDWLIKLNNRRSILKQ